MAEGRILRIVRHPVRLIMRPVHIAHCEQVENCWGACPPNKCFCKVGSEVVQ